MLGKRIGTLRVLKVNNQNESDVQELWSRSNSAGKHWYRIQVDVTSDKEYRVGFLLFEKLHYPAGKITKKKHWRREFLLNRHSKCDAI